MANNEFNPEEPDLPVFEPDGGLGLPNNQEVEVFKPGERNPYSPEYLETIATLAALAQSSSNIINPTTDIDQFQLLVDSNKAAIERGEESALRLQISNQEIADQTDILRTSLILGASSAEANIRELEELADGIEAIRVAKPSNDKLESAALDRLEEFALTHPEQGDMLELIAEDLAANESLTGTLRDQLERSIIIRRDIDKAARAVKEQSLGADILDIVARIIPLNKLTTVNNIVEASLLDLTGTRIKLAQNNLFSISREEFDEKWPLVIEAVKNESGFISENRQLVLEIFHQIGNITESGVVVENFFDFIDFATLAPTVKMVPVLSKAAIAKFGRNRQLAQTVTEKTLQMERDKVISAISGSPDDIDPRVTTIDRAPAASESVVESALDAAQPAAIAGTAQLVDNSVGLSGAVNRSLEANQKAIAAVRKQLEQTPRMTPEEIDDAFNAARAKAIDAHGEGAVIDFKIVQSQVGEDTFVEKFSMVLGRKDGIGYATKASATATAKRKGLLNAQVFKDADDLWFIKVKSDAKEAAYVHVLNEEGRTSSLFINTFLRSPTSFLDDVLQKRAASSVFQKGRIQKLLMPMVNNLKGLSRKERSRVSAVLKKGNIEQKWYNLTDFTRHYTDLHQGRMPTNREVLAYYTVKDLNDFDFILRNHAEYIKRSTQGWITGKVEAANGVKVRLGNMKEVERIDDVNRALILDVSEDVVLEGRKVGLDNLAERMKEQGLKLFRLEGDLKHGGAEFNHVLAKQGDLATKDLEYRQLNYAAGGHRIYDGRYFGKQATIGVTKSGSKTVKNPRTHIVAPTKKLAQEWADRMNAARNAYRRALKDPTYTLQADRILRDSGIEDGIEGYAKLLDEGKVEDAPFQVTFDKEVPKRHKEVLDEDGTYDLTFEGGGQRQFLEQQGTLYYSKKGPVLKGPQDETAGLIDPFAAATRAVENAASIGAYTNYKINAVQRWLATYGNLLPAGDGLSPMQRFWSDFDVSKVKGLDQNTLNRAESIRRAIQRQLGTQTEFGQAVRNSLRNLAEWVEGPVASTSRSRVSKFVLDQMDKDPVSAIKGFSFDLKLGLFDPSQIIIQTQTIFALAALNPRKFHRFMFDGALMRYAAVNQGDEMLNWAAKRSSMSPDEFKSMVRTMRESGITDINGELILLDHTATAALGPVGSTTAKIRDIYAWRKAWDDMRTGIGGKEGLSVKQMLTPEGKAELTRLTDKFTMNMTSASAAWWQKGLLSIPTQFMSYQARLFENILPIIGNKQWSSSEKARLMIGQVMLYGSVGIPGGRFALDNILTATGVELDPNSLADQTAYRAMVGGFWDSMLYAVTNGELDVAFSHRAAVGQAVTDFMERISGGGFETQSVLEFAGGSPFGTIGDVSSDAWDVIKAITRAAKSESVSVVEITPALVQQMAVNAASMSRAVRAYNVWKYGEWISQESGKVLARATPIEGFAAALGFQLRELADMSFARTLIQNRDEFVKSQGKLIAKLQLEAARLWNADDKAGWDLKQREIAAWMQTLDPKDKDDIIKAARTSSDWRITTEIMRDNFDKKFNPQGTPPLPADNSRIK
jgi:hypothetical protein